MPSFTSMMTALKFIASYTAALATTLLVLMVIGIFAYGNETVTSSLPLFLAVLVATAFFALIPAIVFVWSDARNQARLSILRFGIYGLMTAFIESTLLVSLTFNGDLAAGLAYIVSLSLAGFVGGMTIARVWNELSEATLASDR